MDLSCSMRRHATGSHGNVFTVKPLVVRALVHILPCIINFQTIYINADSIHNLLAVK